MIKERLDKIERYKDAIPHWDVVKEVLFREGLEKEEKGKHELSNGCFYIVAEYESKVFQEGKFEFHTKYIDVQIILKGEEIIYNTPLERTEQDSEGYNEENDIAFGSASQYDVLRMKKGDVAVLFPEDSHYPACRAGEAPDNIKKLVVKVPV